MLSSNQRMHRRTGMIHGIECHQVAGAVFATLKANDGGRVAWLLEIYRW